MKRLLVAAVLVLAAGAAALALAGSSAVKLPKCSKQLCQDVGCAADFYCAKGATAVSCAEICGGR